MQSKTARFHRRIILLFLIFTIVFFTGCSEEYIPVDNEFVYDIGYANEEYSLEDSVDFDYEFEYHKDLQYYDDYTFNHSNPIDYFFYKILYTVFPTMFGERLFFNAEHSNAWYIEMNNAFDLLIETVHQEWLKEQIESSRTAYLLYAQEWAETETALSYLSIAWRGGQSSWFDVESLYSYPLVFSENLSPGYGRILAQLYREKTLRLHYWLQIANDTVDFVFDQQKHYERLIEAMPWWAELLNN